MAEDSEPAPQAERAARRPRWTRPVQPPWRYFVLRGLLAGGIVSALFWGYYFALVWRDGDGPLFWALIVWFLCLPAGLLLPFFLVPASTRRVAAGLLIPVACYLVAGFASQPIAHRIRVARLEFVVRDAQPLVDALRAYEAQHGGAPPNLEDLVPDYIAAIPSTGLSGYPVFTYWRRRPSFDGPSWELRLQGPLRHGRDTLVLWSDSGYPAEFHGGRTTLIGEWAYYRRPRGG